MSRCEDEWVSLLEELNRSCGLATATAAVQVTQLVAGQRVIEKRCGALGKVLLLLFVFGLGEIGRVYHRHVHPLALVTPLGWSNCGEVCLPGEA